MPKFISTDWKVVVNSVDLSNHAFDVQIGDEKEQVDVSGFSPTGRKEFLPGTQDQTITVSFLNDFGSASVHQTIWPLYEGGSSFPVIVQPDSDAGTSNTNPWYGGTANVFQYPPSATLNERAEVVVEFKPAPNSLFDWSAP
jgi:hypothetical protein